jgi:glycosyltransferase involved in cell wall biosynthesis
MRILVITAHYPPDFVSGATLQVRRLAEAFASRGHEVDVVAGAVRAGLPDGESRDEDVGPVRIHWLGTAERIDQDLDENWNNPYATALVERIVAERRPEVVHAHALQTLGADVLRVAVDAGVPIVVTMHDLWWWCPRLFLVDRSLRPCALRTTDSTCACARTAAWRLERAAALEPVRQLADRILVPSRALREIVLLNGAAADRVVVDENDIDDAARARPGTITRPSAADADTVHFAYVGGDHPLKGRDVLLEATAQLRRIAGWRLRLFGVPAPTGRGWMRRSYGRRVEFRPAYDAADTAAVLGAADVLVIPSLARESYSLAAREALGSGLAVVTTDCLGPTEVVHDGVNGLIVPLGDATALAAAMRRLIEDRALLARLRAAASARPPTLRSTAEHAAALLELYRDLVMSRS